MGNVLHTGVLLCNTDVNVTVWSGWYDACPSRSGVLPVFVSMTGAAADQDAAIRQERRRRTWPSMIDSDVQPSVIRQRAFPFFLPLVLVTRQTETPAMRDNDTR